MARNKRSPGRGATAPVPTPRQDVQSARDSRTSRMRIAEKEIASGNFEVFKNAQDALKAVQLVVGNMSTRYDRIPSVLKTGKVTVADVRKMNAPKEQQKGGVSIKEIPADLMQKYRENFYDKGRDSTMSLTQYVQRGIAARDLKDDGNKKGGMKAGKKHIMELPTNVPRLQGGRLLGDLNNDGVVKGYERVRQDAIEKSMAAQRKKKKAAKTAKARDGNVRLSDQDKSLIAGYKDKLADARMSDQDKKMAQQLMSAYNARMSDQDKKLVMRQLNNLFKPKKDIQDRNK